MKVQLTLSPKQLALIANALRYLANDPDPIWKELGIIINLAELEAIDGHKRTASYRIINQ